MVRARAGEPLVPATLAAIAYHRLIQEVAERIRDNKIAVSGGAGITLAGYLCGLPVPSYKTGSYTEYHDLRFSDLVTAQAKEKAFPTYRSTSEYRSDPHAAVSSKVKTVVGFYGVYDMAAQWEHDLVTRPRDNIVEKLLGGAPMVNRKRYFDASPMSYTTVDRNTTRFLLLYGHEDDIVDPKTQSERFLLQLKQAGFFARTIVVPGAGHFWSVDPVDEGFGAYAGPSVLRFLEGAL